MANKQRIPHKFLPWIAARKQYQLSNAHIQMARELGLSPKRFRVYADRKNQPWKKPLPEFIEMQYEKQFGKPRPDVVKTIEEIAAAHVAKRAARKAEKALIADVETADVETADVETADVETADVETADVETADVETEKVENVSSEENASAEEHTPEDENTPATGEA